MVLPDNASRFWAKVEKTPGCWLWKGKKDKNGYGLFHVEGKVKKAHRIAWELLNGPIPEGNIACHNCPGGDNTSCVRQSHLFLGTPKDNAVDRAQKGRNGNIKGELNGRAKLTAKQAIEINQLFNAGIKKSELAKKFGVSWTAINHIVTGKNWKGATNERV